MYRVSVGRQEIHLPKGMSIGVLFGPGVLFKCESCGQPVHSFIKIGDLSICLACMNTGADALGAVMSARQNELCPTDLSRGVSS